MCGGGKSKRPKKSAEQIYMEVNQANEYNDRIRQYKEQQQTQSQQFTQTLQNQITASETKAQEYIGKSADLVAAQAEAKTKEVTGSYATTTSSVAPTASQTTSIVKPKQNKKKTLKIAANQIASTSGTGLNIGV